MQSKIEDKPGKFIPPSLRIRFEIEEPRHSAVEDSDNWKDRCDICPSVEEQ
jgi:hypothetical protein